ncbi:MAG: sialate O-acetylesterase [Rubritalea sp.]|uniref:sialate O-acetylesterase n=1 Tax=Rubritalea sp. TaxID=2109375 RepID=UPI0032425D9A
MKFKTFKIVFAAAALPFCAMADVKPAQIFMDHMVIQRETQAPVWGTADASEPVTVTGSWGESAQTVTRADGTWRVQLQTPAAGGPHTITIKGSNSVELRDVLSGEVWVCSGQSNMDFSLKMLSKVVRNEAYKSVNDYLKHETDTADDHLLRQFTVSRQSTRTNLKGEWILTKPEQVSAFTATGYFFGRELRRELKVPVGLIKASVGGTVIEPWIPEEGFQSTPEMTAFMNAPHKVPRHQSPTYLFNTMVRSVIPYAIKGVIWYQGESNQKKRPALYGTHFETLITYWRRLWGQGNFPFYYAQLANYKGISDEPVEYDNWALICEQQRRALVLENTGMAVLNDIGDPKDGHPKNKIDVGKRLAAWALKKDYGVNLPVWSGPLYQSHEIQDGKVTIRFDHVGSGLMTGSKHLMEATKATNDPLQRFQICGKDRKWQWADARISGKDTVEVSHADIAEPTIVRYAWSINPEGANLYNREGFPASLFTTEADLPAAKPEEPSEKKPSDKKKKKKK